MCLSHTNQSTGRSITVTDAPEVLKLREDLMVARQDNHLLRERLTAAECMVQELQAYTKKLESARRTDELHG